MVGSKHFSISSCLHARADLAAFRIVLKQEEGFDVHDTREFDLALDAKFAIGRASKNQSKGFLLPARHNVFIDSPVVSREHAIFTVRTSSGSPHVFITDTKSMHGTYVNGTPLVPQEPKQLFNGDKLQFGVNVNRNESEQYLHSLTNKLTNDSNAGYFMAYKYTFRAELADPEPFSRGFTVPEAESEDEEVDCTPPGRGSQLNPLVLDESDPEPELEDEENDEAAEHSEDNVDVTMAQMEEEGFVEMLDLAEDDDDDEEDENEDDEDDAGMLSDSESDRASTGSAPDYSLELPFVHETQHSHEVLTPVEIPAVQVDPTPVEHGQSQSSITELSPADLLERARATNFFSGFEYPIPAYSPSQPPPVANPWLECVATSSEHIVAPPLPPRPSQKRQRVWDEAPHEGRTWYDEPSFSPPTRDNSTPFHRDLLVAETEPISASLPAADRIQTPPHTESANAAFTPSARESDVVGAEIVDVQPPTPTSINDRKRTADEAFEEETEELIGDKTSLFEAEGTAPAQPTPHVDAREDVVVATVEEVATPPQRPIAQPKGIFRRALRAAKVMVPATALGAVITVTALTTLPESFFTVA